MCGLKRRSSNTMTYLNLTWTTGRTNVITFDWINMITRRKLIWIHTDSPDQGLDLALAQMTCVKFTVHSLSTLRRRRCRAVSDETNGHN